MTGEVQLQRLLEDLLTPGQFERQVRVNPGSAELADFAVRLPGGEDGEPVRLAIDAKFPMDVYERCLDAWDRGDGVAAQAAGRDLESRVRSEAASIGSKYVCTPHTTDFAVMYLPTEGLFAEVARRASLADELRNKHRVVIAGPTTLTALLGSLSMGFRTLAIQKRSSEIATVLGQVKTEFEHSGAVWERMVKQLETATSTANKAGVRHRALARRLRDVEAIPLGGPAAEDAAEVDPPQQAEAGEQPLSA